MAIKQRGDILIFSVIILLSIVGSSHQIVYSCNATASCGCSTNSAVVTRIVGGENATSATWGWAVSVAINNSYLCGGSIISSTWIMTAAHCLIGYRASEITIYAGSTRRWIGTQSRIGSFLIIHPSYNTSTYVNDIALLQLASPLNMNDSSVSTICLPSISSTILTAGEWPPANISVVAVGWGKLGENASLPTTLQQVTLYTVNRQASTCSPLMRDWRVQFCAGDSANGKDTCQGDSGGPLMMFTSSNQWLLVGLTSSGVGCARPSYAGLYTRVAAFESWINSYTNGSVSTLTSTLPTTSISSSSTVFNASSGSSSTSISSVSSTSSSSTRSTVSTTTVSAARSHTNTIGILIFTFFNIIFIFFWGIN